MPESKKHNIIAFYGDLIATTSRAIPSGPDVQYKKNFALAENLPLVKEDFDCSEINQGSIAYHPVFGSIVYRSWWRFSTEKFIADLIAADANPAIVAHIIHVDSLGGEAFGCHEAFSTIKELKKPCYGLIDSVAASAGYYLVAAADKVFASSMFSEVGCIGTMSVMYDDSEMLKQYGLTEREYYSNYSPLKNKVFNDARKGDGDEFVKRFLDPMAFQFIEDIKSVRPAVSQEALQGETYYSTEALPAGLIDGENTLEEIVEMICAKDQSRPSIDINTINF